MPDSSGYHDVHLPEHPARAGVWQAIAGVLRRWIPADGQVLEIGAGYCHWINAVDARSRMAVDLWDGVLQAAGAGVDARILDVSRDLRTLPAGRFDAVLASNVLEHFEPDVAASVVADVAALLKPGGRFLVIQPNFRHAYRRYFDDYTHRSVFTDVSLPNLLRTKGFRIDLVKSRFLPYSMRNASATIPQWLVRAYLASPLKPFAGQMLVVASRA